MLVKNALLATGITAAAFSFATAAQATTVVIVADASNVVTVDAFDTSSTSGNDMDGMVVTGVSAAGSDVATFMTTTGSNGAAVGSGFSLGLMGNSFSGDWQLTITGSTVLTSLTLDGIPGGTIFDTNAGSSTSGSANGNTFDPLGALDSLTGTITATYSNALALTGTAPLGDVFTFLTIDFSGLAGGGLGAGVWAFEQDTDNAAPGTVIVDPNNPVIPLPASGWILLTALGGLAAMRRRKKA